eukprot:scaffold227_cov165-Amphora_coffeaeformis.AAC.9
MDRLSKREQRGQTWTCTMSHHHCGSFFLLATDLTATGFKTVSNPVFPPDTSNLPILLPGRNEVWAKVDACGQPRSELVVLSNCGLYRTANGGYNQY